MKKALVLSGGGAHGAYQVGVLKKLFDSEEYGYDIIAGVSVGAINAVYLSMFKPSEQANSINGLKNLWLSDIKGNDSVYKPWYFRPFNYVASLWKGSLNHTKPLRSILEKRINLEKLEQSGVQLIVGACSLNSGEYIAHTGNENIVNWVMASAAMPLIFQPIEIDGHKLVDGGVRNITPISDIFSSIDDLESIDIVLADPLNNVKNTNVQSSIVDIGQRSIEIMVNEIFRSDLERIKLLSDNKGIKVRIFEPNQPHSYESFDFDPKHLKNAIEIGELETKTVK